MSAAGRSLGRGRSIRSGGSLRRDWSLGSDRDQSEQRRSDVEVARQHEGGPAVGPTRIYKIAAEAKLAISANT